MAKTKKCWKGVLKDDYDLTTLPPPPIAAMLMGSAEIAVRPKTETKFIEDMREEEVAKAGAVLPAGLVNMGNTCYMNSTLQCIRGAEDFKKGILALETDQRFILSLKQTFRSLDASVNAVTPFNFVVALRSSWPQFGEQSRNGGYAQQDAEEFLNCLFTSTAGTPGTPNLVDEMFGLKFEETLTCDEAGDAEPAVIKTDVARKLACNIQGGHGSTIQVNNITEGINLGLKGSIEKNSDVLGRNALWTKTSRIDGLSKYLCVQMVRFYWKATPESADHQGVKCKIMRPILFGETLDTYEFCSDRLKKILKVPRDLKAQEEEERAAKKLRGEDTNAGEDDKMEVEDDDGMDEETRAALALSMQESVDASAGQGLPTNFMGIYELYAVVTHKGRDSSSGHYVAWVRNEGDNWFLFDDDEVHERKTKDILELKGGGDHHMSYLNFYRAKE